MAPSSYIGPVVYNESDKFKKVEFGELDKLAADHGRKQPFSKNADNGWVGMVEHYFVAAWLPPDEPKAPREFYARKLDNGLYAAGVIVPAPPIAPGATGDVKVKLYVGPQVQDTLKTLDTLQLGVPLVSNIDPGQDRLYQVTVGLGQTLNRRHLGQQRRFRLGDGEQLQQ